VLLVDDDMRNAFALNKFLKSRGMEVTIANNGEKALDILKKETRPDIVLMDIMMPVMDGYETMKRIRKQKQFVDLPILALTAKAMDSDREECIKCGANDYLSKPVDTTKLLTMLRVWLYS
jgi:CheY-like chemotaxis protein